MAEMEDTYNKGGFVAFIFSIVFSLVFFIYIAFIHPGVDLKEVPAEASAAAGEMGASDKSQDTVDVSAIADPWNPSDDMVNHGAAVHKMNCAMCHGDTGKGDGPGAAVTPKPRNFVDEKFKYGGTSIDIYKTIAAGVPDTSMAAFKHIPSKDRWGLVQFIRSITADKHADDKAALEAFAKTAE